MTAPRTARARAREELTREIKGAAGRQLAEVGAAALSLRAVARELGMASSAVYRYFPSRDELLTALIVDAYDAVGAAAEQAEAAVDRAEHAQRWLATATGVRTWALAHPEEYALIFGSPVPGYRAPDVTIDPASRVPRLLLRIVQDASTPIGSDVPVPAGVRADFDALRTLVAPDLDDPRLARILMAWTQLIGSISFELFGHLHNIVSHYESYFVFQMRAIGHELCLD